MLRWSAVCNAAERLDFAWISLKSKDKDGNISTEIWRPENTPSEFSQVVVMNVPIKGGDEISHEFEIAISLNGSYESAGHRATLFSRLIDEHKILHSS